MKHLPRASSGRVTRTLACLVATSVHSRILPFMCAPLVLALAGCGGNEPAPRAPAPPIEERADYDSVGDIGASAEIGALPEEETVAAFTAALEPIQACFLRGTKRVEFLGGEIAFNVVVGNQGKVQDIYAERSTLGDRETERCMFGALKSAAWPEPVGGPVGIAKNGFEFEMTGDVRPPVVLSDFDPDTVLADQRSAIRQCKGSHGDSFTATVYIDTNGSAISAGIAAPDPAAEGVSDCLVDLIKNAKFPSPGSWPGKATFTL